MADTRIKIMVDGKLTTAWRKPDGSISYTGKGPKPNTSPSRGGGKPKAKS